MPQESTVPRRQRSYLVEAAMAVLGISLTIALYFVLVAMEKDALEAHFTAVARERILQVEQQLSNNSTAIYSFSSFRGSGPEAEHADFQTAANQIFRAERDLTGAFWAPRVKAADRAEFERRMQELGVTDIVVPAPPADNPLASLPPLADDSFPIEFAAPADTADKWLGHDFSKSPEYAATIVQAVQSGQPTWTPMQPFAGRQSYVILRSVFRDADVQDTLEDRIQKLLGFVVLVLPIDDVFNSAFHGDDNQEINIQAFTVTDDLPMEFAWAYNSQSQSVEFTQLPAHEIHFSRPVRAAGNRWHFYCTPSETFLAEGKGPTSWIALLLGLGLTTVGVAYAHAMINRKTQIEWLVQERTRELKQANDSLEMHISERERAELALRISEHRFRSLVENASDLIWELDPDGKFTYVSPQITSLLGYTSESVIGLRFCDLLVEDQREAVREGFCDAATKSESLVTVENTLLHASGDAVLMETNATPIHDGNGDLVGYRGITRDITDRIKAEQELAYERFLLNTLLEHSLDFIYFKDAECRFIRISKALADYFGMDHPQQAEGKTDFDVFDEEFAAQFYEDERQVMRTGEPVINKEERQLAPNGQTIWMSTTKVCLRNPAGDIIGTFGISRDVTAGRLAAEALRRAKEDAEAVSRAKSAFLANMSHEIRTPMNAVIGMTELLLETDLTPSQRDYLKMVLESGESLLSILNDILDFSKIEAGKLDLESEKFELRETLGDTMKALAFRAHAKGLELLCSIGSDVPELLRGDNERLKQVVINLVTNAIKFTHTGEVILSVELQEQLDQSAVLKFTIADTGVGIPGAMLARVFDAFEQADVSTKRKFGGTGLGLAICSQLCSLMGGKIWAESVEGVGSQFHFELPFEIIGGARPVTPPAGIPGRRVLVVDDNATNCRILGEMLKSWEMLPECAHGADRARSLLAQSQQDGKPFDIVLVDARIAKADGFTFAEQIRQDGSFHCQVIMMLTSGDRPAEMARCERLGMTTYLLKPVKRSELFDAIATILNVASAEADGGEVLADDLEPEIPPLKILLAEDSMVNQRLAIGLLNRRGHTLVIAGNGGKAVEEYGRHAFDLILMDLEMPEMDGFEATATIRSKERESGDHIPIIAMTAHAMKGDRERCLAGGMDGYVPKPVRAKTLFSTIFDVLRDLGRL